MGRTESHKTAASGHGSEDLMPWIQTVPETILDRCPNTCRNCINKIIVSCFCHERGCAERLPLQSGIWLASVRPMCCRLWKDQDRCLCLWLRSWARIPLCSGRWLARDSAPLWIPLFSDMHQMPLSCWCRQPQCQWTLSACCRLASWRRRAAPHLHCPHSAVPGSRENPPWTPGLSPALFLGQRSFQTAESVPSESWADERASANPGPLSAVGSRKVSWHTQAVVDGACKAQEQVYWKAHWYFQVSTEWLDHFLCKRNHNMYLICLAALQICSKRWNWTSECRLPVWHWLCLQRECLNVDGLLSLVDNFDKVGGVWCLAHESTFGLSLQQHSLGMWWVLSRWKQAQFLVWVTGSGCPLTDFFSKKVWNITCLA